jgi:ketosteroid isomerase-like protein
MACLAYKAAIMGTGPGEIWAGPAEIKMAYERFFEGFDKGEQDFDYHFRIGDVGSDMGWLMTSGEVTGQKDGKPIAFPLNVSLTVRKEDGDWKNCRDAFFDIDGRREGEDQGDELIRRG